MVWVIIAVSVFLSVYPSPSQHEMHSVRVSNTKAVSPCRWWQLCCMWFWVSLQYRYLSTAQTNPFRPTTSHCATDSRSVRFNVQIFSRSVLAVEPCTDFTQWRRHTAALQKPSLSGADIQRPCGRLHSVAQTHSSPAQNFTQWRRHTAALHKTSLSGADTQQPCTKLHSVAHTHSGPAQNFTQWRRHRAALHKTSLSGADTEQPCTKLHSVAQTHIDPAQTPLSGANTQLSVSTGMKPTAKGAVPTTVPPGDVTLGQWHVVTYRTQTE